MQFRRCIPGVITAPALVHAHPTKELAVYSPGMSKELAARQANCELINVVVSAIGTSSSKVIYTVSASVIALSLCQLLRNHSIGGIGPDDCYPISGIIASAFAAIFTLAGFSSEPAPEESTDDAPMFTLEGRLKKAMLPDLWTFDVIQAVEPESANIDKPMLDHAVVSGLKHGNATMDMLVADFGSGQGHIRLQAPGLLTKRSDGKLVRRHDGPGFKVSFTSRLPSLLTSEHQWDASWAFANVWWRLANYGSMGDYIGSLEPEHYSNFYYRVICETGGFGDEYESVDYPCGGMADYL